MEQDGSSIAWRKSSASAQGNCVEVGAAGDSILVRDTKDRAGRTLSFTVAEWQAFLTGVGSGEFSVETLRES